MWTSTPNSWNTFKVCHRRIPQAFSVSTQMLIWLTGWVTRGKCWILSSIQCQRIHLAVRASLKKILWRKNFNTNSSRICRQTSLNSRWKKSLLTWRDLADCLVLESNFLSTFSCSKKSNVSPWCWTLWRLQWRIWFKPLMAQSSWQMNCLAPFIQFLTSVYPTLGNMTQQASKFHGWHHLCRDGSKVWMTDTISCRLGLTKSALSPSGWPASSIHKVS